VRRVCGPDGLAAHVQNQRGRRGARPGIRNPWQRSCALAGGEVVVRQGPSSLAKKMEKRGRARELPHLPTEVGGKGGRLKPTRSPSTRPHGRPGPRGQDTD
jgi:hypothetical protein